MIAELELEAVRSHGVELPTRHARRFARPCRRCWPELNKVAQLELDYGPTV